MWRRAISALLVGVSLSVAACRDGGGPDSPPPSPASTPAPGASTSVFLVDTAKGSIEHVPAAEGVAFAQWVSDHEIVGWDWIKRAYVVIDVGTGQHLSTFGYEPGNMRTEFVAAASQSGEVIIERDGGQRPAGLVDARTGAEAPFAAPPGQNAGFAFSPDGGALAFNNIVDGAPTPMILLDGESAPRVLARAVPPSAAISLMPEPWSADGRWLLLVEQAYADGCTEPCEPHITFLVVDVNGDVVLRVGGASVAAQDRDCPSGVQWAGASRLLCRRNRVEGSGEVAEGWFITVPSGDRTPVPAELFAPAASYWGDASYSPDNQHAVNLIGESDAPWERRCALVEIHGDEVREVASGEPAPGDHETVFCATVDWTEDGSKAIVSAGGI